MRQLLPVITLAILATSGCAGNRLLGRLNCGKQPCHITRFQSAPGPGICRTACRPSGCSKGLLSGCADDCCDAGCCCDDACCGPSDGGCGFADCGCNNACGGSGCGLCQRFAGRVASGFCPHGGGYPESYNFAPSSPGGQVAYPYYTVRGPRDFFSDDPPSIGPY